MDHSLPRAVRVTAVIVALLLTGEALAEQKSPSGDQAMANCLNQAMLQLSIDQANCSPLAAFPNAYNPCMGQAIYKYQQAVTKCTTSALTTNRFARLKHVQVNSDPITVSVGRN